MESVTSRIRQIKQPRGGFVKPSEFTLTQLFDNNELHPIENLHPTLIGIVVDYLTRYRIGDSVENAFEISIKGTEIAGTYLKRVREIDRQTSRLITSIVGLDDSSIISACKLASFDVWYRNICAVQQATPSKLINPDTKTIDNIRVMVERSVNFWKLYGPVINCGFTFEPYGYTDTIMFGDGDYLTKDTIWDLKVSKNKLTSKHTLQLLMYWIMGQHSGNPIFENINKVGIFNPRLNNVYILNTSDIPYSIIHMIETDVICY